MFEDKKECKKNKCCVDIVITILAIAFAFIIGVIIGATTGIYETLGIGAFVVLAVILGILIITRIINLICCKDKKDKCCCKE